MKTEKMSMPHEKVKSLIVFMAIFAIVGGISWALVNAQQSSNNEDSPQAMPKLRLQENLRDAALAYIVNNHPETAQFTNNISWTGGKQETGLLGSETYIHGGKGWQVTIQYPVIPNPVYEITANYNTPTESGTISIPYAIIWTGVFEDGTTSETSYTFAQ